MPLSFPRFLVPFSDHETVRCADHARRTGRSWWALRYSWLDDWVHEWDPELASPNKHKDWPLMPKRGRQAVRLYCPNGKFVQLGDTHDATGKLFQLKVGVRHVAVNRQIGTLVTKQNMAHVIGMVHGTNGECTIYAWEPLPPPAIPIDAPKPPDEREWIAKSAAHGLYEKAVAEWERAFDEYTLTAQYRDWKRRYQVWEANAGGRLVGPIEDNVYATRYQNIGSIKAEYLGIDDGEGK